MRDPALVDDLFLTDERALAAAVARLPAEDAVALPLLGDDVRQPLLEAARQMTYRPARPLVGEGARLVRQDFELSVTFPEDSPFPRFATALEGLLRRALVRLSPQLLDKIQLNDLIVQHYQPGSAGITPHRDHVRYEGLVALVNLAGRARFCVCTDRSGANARELDDGPGVLLLMRAPGFAGRRDRPFHFLKDVSEERYSLGLRHDIRAGEPMP